MPPHLADAVPRAPTGRRGALLWERRRLLEAGGLAAAVAILLVSVLPNLANHPTVTDDEVWIMSASYKLAKEGVFGSDMFAGFYNAERRYYLNMPGHHLVLAGVFKVFGAGVVEARLVGVAYGVAVILLSYAIARRLYGVGAAFLTLGLLLFLRLNMGFDTGLPLQELSSSVRYDLAPVPFLLLAFCVLLGAPSVWRAAAAGALVSVATLMQFYAVFLAPVALLALLLEEAPGRRRLGLAAAFAGAGLLVAAPYGAYVLSGYEDFKGQVGTIEERTDFLSPGFYWESLTREPERFLRPLAFKEVPRGADHETTDPQVLSLRETLQRRPSAKIGVLLGLPAAAVFAGWRGLSQGGRGDRLLFLTLVGLPLQYALLESAKLYIYWIAVVPFLCVGIAGLAAPLLRPPPGDRLRLALAGGVAAILLLFLAEGGVARVGGIRTAGDETEYAALARALHEHVPPGSRVVGSTSLWWALRDTEYRSYFLFFYLTNPNAGRYRGKISDYLAAFRPQYLVLTRLAIGELEKHLVASDYADLDVYLVQHATRVVRLEKPLYGQSYGFIDVWRFDP
jgi:4-amino-4-deoxy-L-arabinose transferase-like glycosyltransferase